MAKSKRVLGAVLSIIMVLTMIPTGLIGASAIESTAEVLTPVATSIDNGDGGLVVPTVTVTSTKVIRVASAAGAYTPGTTIVAATDSGLPAISSSFSSQYYCDETPYSPTVVFTSDKALSSTPTIACENNTGVTFSSPLKSGNTYTWTITAGTNVTVGALKFVVGYSYSYTDSLTGKTISKTYQAFATSYVENIAQPGGVYAYRERSAAGTLHEREHAQYVARILGANTYGSYFQNTDDSGGKWGHGYYNFDAAGRQQVNLGSSNAAAGYGLVIYDGGTGGGDSSDGTKTTNTSSDFNRPVSTTYVDRGLGTALSGSNLRLTMFESANGRDNYTFYARYGDLKVLEGEVDYAGDSAANNTARGQLGISSDYATDVQVAPGAYVNVPLLGNSYGDAATVQDNGNYLSTYTLVTGFGTLYSKTNRVANITSAINIRIISYDKSELRGYMNELLTENAPTVKLAADSEIGIYPQASWYSAGWDAYKTAFQDAQALLNQPTTDQNTIDATLAALETAVAGLVVKEADYTVITTAMEQLSQLDANNYTEESWSAVQTAQREVTNGYSVFYQSAVDKMAENLNNAINGLEYAPANYDNVNAIISVYESLDPTQYSSTSWSALQEAVNAVNWDLTIDKQAMVEAYALAIQNAIEALEYALADYTEVTAQVARYNEVLPNQDLYTVLSWRRVSAAYNAIEYDLDLRYQEDVDDYATNLRNAINTLAYKDADYTQVDAAIEVADALNQSWYTPKSYAAVTAAVAAVVEGKKITEQAEVDAMAKAINDAIAALVEADGNYDAVDAAVEAANNLTESNYTPTSWALLQNAISAVDYDLTAKNQTTIDGYASAINAAISALVEVDANYDEVNAIIDEWSTFANKSNYTNSSIVAVTNAINAVDWDLKISQQATVDGYVTAIRNAIDALELKGADYTAVNNALADAKTYTDIADAFAENYDGYSYYTADSYKALTDAIAAVVTGYDITRQADVDAMATAINSAIGALAENEAKYTAVDAALATIPADLTIYTDDSVAAVLVAQNAVDRTLTTADQADVDAMAEAIAEAVAGLEKLGADYTDVDAALATVPTDLTIYTAESVAVLNDAIAAVVRGYDITRQADVDAMATAINDAVAALELNSSALPADYSQVDAAIEAANTAIADTNYTDDSIAAVNDAIDAVVRGLLGSEQARVDAMATAINDAVSRLTYKPLDTTAYDSTVAAIPDDMSIYTDESVEAVNNAKDAAEVFITGHDIRNQAEFDALVTALSDAIGALAYKDADYSSVDAAIAAANALTQSNYVDFSAVTAAIDAVVEGKKITEQADVDAMAQAINDAIDALELKPADYTSVENALATIPDDLSIYTDDSVASVNAAVENIDYSLDITDQPAVDGFATAINTAVSGLKYKGADYSELDALVQVANNLVADNYENYDDVYWDYLYSYISITIPSNRSYLITEQDAVDNMTATLQSYLDMLIIKDADYSAVNEKVTAANEAIDTGYYTDESVAALQSILDGINYDYDILHQSDVDAYVPQIEAAIAALEEKPSDFSQIEALYAEILALDPDGYENYDEIYYEYILPFYSTDIASGKTQYTKISQQSSVDALYATLQEYYDMLIPIEQETELFIAKEGSTTVIKNNTIYGLKTSLTKAAFEASYVTMENVTVTYALANSKRFLGTGSTVTVTSNITGEVVGVYTIVIYGDINGDGLISPMDITALNASLTGETDPLTGVYKTAGNINGDRFLNAKDSMTLNSVTLGLADLDQSTGKAI